MRFNLDQHARLVILERQGTAVNCNPYCNPSGLITCADARISPVRSSRLPSTHPKGSGPATEAQAHLRVYVHRLPFLHYRMPTVTDGLAPEESVCWAPPGSMADGMIGLPPQPPTVFGKTRLIILEPERPRRRQSVWVPQPLWLKVGVIEVAHGECH